MSKKRDGRSEEIARELRARERKRGGAREQGVSGKANKGERWRRRVTGERSENDTLVSI